MTKPVTPLDVKAFLADFMGESQAPPTHAGANIRYGMLYIEHLHVTSPCPHCKHHEVPHERGKEGGSTC